MKKTYIQPNVEVMNVNIKSTVLTGSLLLGDSIVEDENGGWAREEQRTEWDIWTNEEMYLEEEEEGYYY